MTLLYRLMLPSSLPFAIPLRAYAPIAVLVGLASLVVASFASAEEGRLEINQTCATTTGCFSGDNANFPVTISNPGSYVVTSDLVTTGNVDGIVVTAGDVTLDMNGFRLVNTGSTNTSVNGIEVRSVRNFEVRGGSVDGFRGRGIIISNFTGSESVGARVIDMRTANNGFQGVDVDGPGHLISGCTSVGNLLWGFSVDSDSLITDSVAANNVAFGLQMGGGGYRNTAVNNNNGGNANAQITGVAVDLGGNMCGGDAVCP